MERKLAPATIRSKTSMVRGFYRWAQEEGLVEVSPVHRIPPQKAQKAPPRALPIEKLQALLQAPYTHSVKGCRDRAVLQVMWEGGLRRSEVSALLLRDVELDTGRVWVTHGKGGKSRVVCLGPAGLEAVQRWLRVRSELAPSHDGLFLETHTMGPLGPGTVSKIAAHYLEGIGMEPTRYPSGHTRSLGSHALRHTCATQMLKANAPLPHIQRYLGHERLETTAVYMHANDEDVFASARLIPVIR